MYLDNITVNKTASPDMPGNFLRRYSTNKYKDSSGTDFIQFELGRTLVSSLQTIKKCIAQQAVKILDLSTGMPNLLKDFKSDHNGDIF